MASDTNDFVTLSTIEAENDKAYKAQFLADIHSPKNYRKITKNEACEIQGFPSDFQLPNARERWMKLIGNSVSVPVIDILCKAIVETGAFERGKKMVKQEQVRTNSMNKVYAA